MLKYKITYVNDFYEGMKLYVTDKPNFKRIGVYVDDTSCGTLLRAARIGKNKLKSVAG